VADWALILGSSSGFGEAATLAFAEAGYNVYGIHLDRKSTLAHVDEVVEALKETGAEVEFFNLNAADPEKRREVVQHIAERLRESGDKVRVLLHSLAFGTLKPYIDPEGKAGIAQREVEMTLDVMANTLVYWVQDVVRAGLMGAPALRKIPGHEEMIEFATGRNPHGRLTTPQDVARALVALARPETQWMTGNVIGVDGGEEIAG
jgi:NAD(P)-dependent dehydrogenase (short-subunit alcohol dehydrogenase family)